MRTAEGAWRAGLAAALVLAAPAHAQGLGEARAFVGRLYAAYASGTPDYLSAAARTTFTPHLLALIRRDRDTAPEGEAGILDGDPICDCQDAGGLRMSDLAVEPAGPGRARARLRLRFPGETRAATIDLQSVGGHWRVADVHTRDTPSLVKLLEDGLRERRARAR